MRAEAPRASPEPRATIIGSIDFSTSTLAPGWQVKVEDPVKLRPIYEHTAALESTKAAPSPRPRPPRRAQANPQRAPRQAPFIEKAFEGRNGRKRGKGEGSGEDGTDRRGGGPQRSATKAGFDRKRLRGRRPRSRRGRKGHAWASSTGATAILSGEAEFDAPHSSVFLIPGGEEGGDVRRRGQDPRRRGSATPGLFREQRRRKPRAAEAPISCALRCRSA